MYTEISHFLLLHAIFIANFWIWNQRFRRIGPKELLIRIFHFESFSKNLLRMIYSQKHKNNQKSTKKSEHNLRFAPFVTHVASRLNYKANPQKISISGNIHRERANAGGLELEFAITLIFSTFFFTLTSCFFGTISNYVCSDFSIYNILTNSTADIPLFYKISATWSNHEGSLLLWCWLLSLNTFLFCISIKNSKFASQHNSSYHAGNQSRHEALAPTRCTFLPRRGLRGTRVGLWGGRGYHNNPLWRPWMTSFQSTKSLDFALQNHENLGKNTEPCAALILIFFTTFCVATSNPFLRASIPCISSLADLNPVLQDPVLAIHPPCIYAGYVASAIVFCLCMSNFYKNPQSVR